MDWETNFDPQKHRPRRFHFWVKLENLSSNYWNKQSLEKTEEAIGSLTRIEEEFFFRKLEVPKKFG